MDTNRSLADGSLPIVWSAVWVGALAALAVGLVIGLTGHALGAHEVSTRVVNWKAVRLVTLVFSIGGAFLAFVVGGWAAASIANFRSAEPSMVHGALAWLVAVPVMLVLGALGGLTAWGGWYGGLVGAPVWSSAAFPAGREAAEALRNGALAALTALLLGLVGSVLGGWMASGEPMSLAHYRRRGAAGAERSRRAA
jgi:hypothetical protein